jgi:hypothetical protein
MRAFRRGSPRAIAPAGFPDVEQLLAGFVTGLTELLGDELAGSYLHGSLALGAFNPEQSDVDFLVATGGDLSAEQVEALAALHLRLGERLDGSYLPLDVFRRFDPNRVMHPQIEARGGRLLLDHHGGETVIYRYVLRKCGVGLSGPTPQSLIDPVDADQLRGAVRDLVAGWSVDDEPQFAEAGFRRYTVQTMCRVRYTLACGDVASKPEAVAWGLEEVEPVWRDLIRRVVRGEECG